MHRKDSKVVRIRKPDRGAGCDPSSSGGDGW